MEADHPPHLHHSPRQVAPMQRLVERVSVHPQLVGGLFDGEPSGAARGGISGPRKQPGEERAPLHWLKTTWI